jgi:hypothetical protein
MSRGLDSGFAEKLRNQGHTLASLKATPATALQELGLTPVQVQTIYAGPRAGIPSESLARTLWASRWTCCVCREPKKAVIVHHIRPWAQSHNHGEANLVALCLEHHAQAHRRGDLERNLDTQMLVDHKARWEAEVARLDVRAVFEATALPGHHWLWFNHRRLLDLAQQLGIRLTDTPWFPLTFEKGFVDDRGFPKRNDEPYVASGGDGNYLLTYLRWILHEVLATTALFNVSDDLDRGFLARVVHPGDLILVQGRHVFKNLSKIAKGPGQAVSVRRRANGVEVSFTIDRWEAVATSAWGAWLTGTQCVASIVRVVDVEPTSRGLQVRATGLAIGLMLRGLATRSYASPGMPVRRDSAEAAWDPLEEVEA